MEERREMVVLNERISVGCGGQVDSLINKLASNKLPTDHLEHDMAGNNE
jgi:hypothetical protein